MTLLYDGLNALPYTLNPVPFVVNPRDPTQNDYQNFNIGTQWLNNKTQVVWQLVSLGGTVADPVYNQAIWVQIVGGSGNILGLRADNAVTAFPVAGIINTFGDSSTITTSASGNTVTFSANGSGIVSSLTTQDGHVVTPTAGTINVVGTGSVATTGTVGPDTATIALTGVTQYNVQTGGASSALHNVAPSATSGVPLISQGASAQPAFGTAVVAGGGTGDTSFTAYAPVCGGTTTTGALQSASTGISNSGYVLTSNGSSTLPSFKAIPSSPASACSFFAYNDTDEASYFMDSVLKTIQYPATLFNIGANFNASTYTFTAPNTGYYSFQCAVSLINVNSTDIEYSMTLLTTGGTYLLSNGNPYSMSDIFGESMGVNQSLYIAMSAGDTAKVQFLVHGTVGTTGISGYGGSLGSQYRTIFSGYQVV